MTCAVKVLNLSIVASSYIERTLRFQTSKKVAIDVSSWEFSLMAKKNAEDADDDAIITLTDTDFVEGDTTNTREFKILAEDGDGNPLAVQELFYQLKIVYDSATYDYPQTYLEGTLAITRTAQDSV